MAARPCSTPWETYSKLPHPHLPDRLLAFRRTGSPGQTAGTPFLCAGEPAGRTISVGDARCSQRKWLDWAEGAARVAAGPAPTANGFHFFEKIQEVPVGKSCLPAKNSRQENQKKPPSVKKLDGIFFPKNACIFQSPRNSGIIFFLARDMHLKGVRNEPDAISL